MRAMHFHQAEIAATPASQAVPSRRSASLTDFYAPEPFEVFSQRRQIKRMAEWRENLKGLSIKYFAKRR